MALFLEGQDPLDQSQAPAARAPLGTPEPSLGEDFSSQPVADTISAAFRQANPVAHVLDVLTRQSPDSAYDPAHNPLDDIRGTDLEQNHLNAFLDSPNEQTTQSIIASIRRDETDRQTLAASGGVGTAATVAAGLTDPSFYLPFAGEARAGAGLLEVAGRAAALGALQSTVSQAALKAGSPGQEWTAQDGVNIASNTLLMGFLGGALHMMAPKEIQQAEADLDAVRPRVTPVVDENGVADPGYQGSAENPLPANDNATGLATAAGAAASDTRNLDPLSYGLDKVPWLGRQLNKVSPNTRIFFNSDSTQAKRALADLAENAFTFRDSAAGVPTALNGPPVESDVRALKNQFEVASHQIVQDNWVAHRYGANPPNAAVLAAAREGIGAATEGGKLSLADFKTAMYDAGINGDTHEIPEVQTAAQQLRAQVLDPIQKMAQETQGPDGRPMLAEELQPPKGDASFMPRLWNHEALTRNYAAVRQDWANWLGEEQAANAATRDRISELSDRLQAAGPDDDIGGIRKELETEVANWRGNTTEEALRAIRDRPEQGVGGGRSVAADSAVDSAVQAILKADVEKSPDELLSRASEILNRIISTPDGRLPYDAPSGGPQIGFDPNGGQQVRGSLNAREFAIPTARVAKYVERDIDHVVTAHLRTTLPDILLTRKFGDVDMTEQMKKIVEEYDAKIKDGMSEAQQKKIVDARNKDISDVAAVRDRIRGVYGWSADPNMRKFGAMIRDAQNLNALSSLGTSVLNRLTDFSANATYRYGFMNVFRDQWMPLLQAMMGQTAVAREAKQQALDAGVGADGLLGHMRNNLYDINNSYRPGNKFSRGLAWATDRSMLVNLHGPWTDWNKALAWNVAQGEFGRAAARIAAGKGTKSDLSRMATASIDPAMATRISQQYDQFHTAVKGRKFANVSDWTDDGARRAFNAAMSREANSVVLTAGAADKPLWMSNQIWSLLGQFHSFTAAAHEKILISNLQRRDGNSLQGLMMSVAMGMLSYRLYSLASGGEVSDNPADWIKEGISRSAMTGWLSDANLAASKFTSGAVDYNRLYGATMPDTRHRDLSLADVLGGPTYARANSLLGVTDHATQGKFSAADIHQLRLALPLQNLMFMRRLLDQVEGSTANAFGLPQRQTATAP